MINTGVKRRTSFDIIAVLILIVLAIWLFRSEFQGYIWIGNPDRLNSDLKITQHYLAHSPIQAWNQNEMMGYDSFALPYIYPHFLLPILKWFGISKEFVVMGYLVIALLAMTGVASYFCVRSFTGANLATLTAAICYQFSGLTLLKVSQNAMSFSVFIVIPLAIWCLRSLTRNNMANRFLFLSILLSLMLEFMFLQKSAYALLLFGLYSIWISSTQKKIYPLIIFSASLLTAMVFSGPRILGIFEIMAEYARTSHGWDFKKFHDIYHFQHVYPCEILRWFDAGIFGRFPSDAVKIKNNINLTEGFLLYTSSVVPFLLIWAGINVTFHFKRSFFRSDFFFFSLIFIACLLVIIWPMATEALYLLFFKMDFTHARILIIGQIALVILLAKSLVQISPKLNINQKNISQFIIFSVSLCVALLFYWFVEICDHSYSWGLFRIGINLNEKSVDHILATFMIVLCLFILNAFGLPWMKDVVYKTLCFFIIIQCISVANFTINGSQNFNVNYPFFKGDMYYARSQEFIKPSREQIYQLNQAIQSNLYRVALICDKRLANGFCAGHVPEYWNLRAIDGYYGIGVPKRIRALPWKQGIDLRTLSFDELDSIPWKLLGFLNVKSVLVVNDGLYRNIISKHNQIISTADPNRFTIIPSPEHVTPRAFFAQSVQSVASLDEAVHVMFKDEKITQPEKKTVIENFNRKNFPNNKTHHPSHIHISGDGDDLFIQFKPVSKERFLVLNELYSPRWRAEAKELPIPIFPTNVVMRGVVVPPGVDSVHFYYTPLSTTLLARLVQVGAFILLIIIFMYLKRYTRSFSEQIS